MRASALIIAVLLALHCAWAEPVISNGSFERLDARGMPEDWEPLGDVSVTRRAHSGDRAVLLQRDGLEGETGLNRAWRPGSGEQGKMLAQLRGGVSFWYMALEASDPRGLTFNIIPMSDEPLEVGGLRTTFVVPAEHVGDGRWHRGLIAYDYTGEPDVRWVQISPRLHGERAAMIIDSVEWVERIGPIATIGDLALDESPDAPGRLCTISTRIRNTGDEPLLDAEATLELPPGLAVSDALTRSLGDLPPGEVIEARWEVRGARDQAARIGVSVDAQRVTASRGLEIAPELEIAALLAAPAVLEQGGDSEVTVLLRNEGDAIVRGITADLRAGAPLSAHRPSRRERAELPPGGEAALTWRVAATGQCPAARLQVIVRAENSDPRREAHEVVVGPPMPQLPGAAVGAGAIVNDRVAMIGDGQVRIVFPRADFGFGIARVQRRVGRDWQTVAGLPRLSRLVTDGGAARPVLVYADTARVAERDGANAALEFTANVTDGGGVRWRIAQTVGMREGARSFELEHSAAPAEPAGLLAFDGPMVCVGDGAPEGSVRRDAIFPGLEWLEEGEHSSNALAIAPDHPHRLRYVPHPHMVTLPLMVARLDTPTGPDVAVSLSWDHLRPYVRDRDRPSVLFASPDRFEGRRATTLGLFAPSMPDLIEPNARTAHTPLALDADETVTLATTLTVLECDDGETALVGLRRWFDEHGAPPPRPLPHGESLADEIAFNMAGYLRSLWNEEQQKWHPIFFGPPDWREPRWRADFLYDLRLGSELASDAEVARAARERYEHVVELSRLAPAADDAGFHFAGPAGHLLGEGREVENLIAEQHDDGSWRFRAYVATEGVFKGRDYAELGPDGAAEVGTCAANARRILRFARMTGDERASEAGLRALEFMERFEIPRAAQTWEVPVHAPDILAAARACEAFLEGYLLTGEGRHLDRAVYWAWAGLPFVYIWDTEGFEFLRYASVPVFGATWHEMSWFGKPVQWNGLDYAAAVRRLAAFDDSAAWETIADGLTVSAMYQQYTDERYQALWPDAISAIDLSDTGANFAPRQILSQIYEMLGLQTRPVTVSVPVADGAVHVSAAARISDASAEGDRLCFEVTSLEPIGGFALVAGLTRPGDVRVGGHAAREVASAAEEAAPTWRYLDDHALLELRLAEPGTHAVELRGVTPRPAMVRP